MTALRSPVAATEVLSEAWGGIVPFVHSAEPRFEHFDFDQGKARVSAGMWLAFER